MANIHPFFGGVEVTSAANWTLQFLDNNVIPTTVGLSPQPSIIISEGISLETHLIPVGWPSGGGNISGSVAGISELQTFINTFPGAAKDANVNYYWFEGYDEPWKVIYDTPTAAYEDKWVISSYKCLMIGIIGRKWVFKGWHHVAEFSWIKI
jgi:exo-beta-1,3-glucanase (GH17 family)